MQELRFYVPEFRSPFGEFKTHRTALQIASSAADHVTFLFLNQPY